MDLVNNKKIQNHVPMKHNDIVRKRISFINEGGGITKNIPKAETKQKAPTLTIPIS